MSLIREHDLERCILERRLSYLSIIDDFVDTAFHNHECQADLSDKDSSLKLLRTYYKDVYDIDCLTDTLKKIYSSKQYGKVIK